LRKDSLRVPYFTEICTLVTSNSLDVNARITIPEDAKILLPACAVAVYTFESFRLCQLVLWRKKTPGTDWTAGARPLRDHVRVRAVASLVKAVRALECIGNGVARYIPRSFSRMYVVTIKVDIFFFTVYITRNMEIATRRNHFQRLCRAIDKFFYTRMRKRRGCIRACLGNTFVAALVINREFTRARARISERGAKCVAHACIRSRLQTRVDDSPLTARRDLISRDNGGKRANQVRWRYQIGVNGLPLSLSLSLSLPLPLVNGDKAIFRQCDAINTCESGSRLWPYTLRSILYACYF